MSAGELWRRGKAGVRWVTSTCPEGGEPVKLSNSKLCSVLSKPLHPSFRSASCSCTVYIVHPHIGVSSFAGNIYVHGWMLYTLYTFCVFLHVHGWMQTHSGCIWCSVKRYLDFRVSHTVPFCVFMQMEKIDSCNRPLVCEPI